MSNNANKYPTIDAHLDLGMYLRKEKQMGRHKVLETDYLNDMRAGHIKAVVSAIFVDDKSESGTALQQACEQIAAIQTEVAESSEYFAICTTYHEIEAAYSKGKVALILSFEGIEPLGGNTDLLDFFYRVGVRGLGLAHARRNLACDGARYTDSKYNIGCGLTDYGINLIKKAEKYHMLIDVSHLNDAGTEDVLNIVSCPVIASHSNCRSINNTRRNLTDEQIRRIADTGGVIGINGCNGIISDKPDTDSMEMMLCHLDHMVNVGGIDCVGLGFDMASMIMPNGELLVNGVKIPLKDTVPNYSELTNLVKKIEERGYDDTKIEKIFSKNFSRVYKEVLL